MLLALTAVGESGRIKRVAGNAEVKKHLRDLGFVVGSDVTVLTAIGGNMIIQVKEARVALSREMAQKILI